MTREEAIELKAAVGRLMYSSNKDVRDYNALIDFIESALRPVSRERVEKVWPGCEACKNAGLAIGEVQFYGPFEGSIDVSGNMQYCPSCGRPLTEQAWDELEKRLRG